MVPTMWVTPGGQGSEDHLKGDPLSGSRDGEWEVLVTPLVVPFPEPSGGEGLLAPLTVLEKLIE